jgi:hypothetical protein
MAACDSRFKETRIEIVFDRHYLAVVIIERKIANALIEPDYCSKLA